MRLRARSVRVDCGQGALWKYTVVAGGHVPRGHAARVPPRRDPFPQRQRRASGARQAARRSAGTAIAALSDGTRDTAARHELARAYVETRATSSRPRSESAQDFALGAHKFALHRDHRHSERDERIIPTKDEIKLINDNAPASHRVMFITAIFTGMRISELRGPTWDNVDLDRGLVRVRQRADEHCVLGKPKSRAGYRDVPKAPSVKEALEQWRFQVPETTQRLVFPNGASKIQNYANIYNRVFKPMLVAKRIVDDAGDARFGRHALRHAAALTPASGAG
ncbi:tyrosine-type recombinase/integrase [Salipiger mangrovisoli]|uniref:Tyrosine-type recombinase/integrase n=1 Tax=Salipiger mangrovisoli TaxID=2865933 RepID=A0ABR9XAL3_9RHOB|nr:tyrosine-type recombinase/integrase [Salipiger mangrovisoli]MBE9640641.1 tyrosine-type recombinase/integrase [Salipiger mangrovisoli]